jgi:hypothetical protein
MDKTDKYIDDLFHQKFSGAGTVIPPSGGDWVQISKAIRKKNFFRFTPGSFNVFYLTAAATAITTVGSFVLPGMINKNTNESMIQPSVNQVVDSLSKADTLSERHDSLLIIKLESSQTTCSSKKSECHNLKHETTFNNSNQYPEDRNDCVTNENRVEVRDSLINSTEKVNPGIEEKIIKNQRFKKIALSDTLIKIDTIHIQKKGIQFKRKRDGF